VTEIRLLPFQILSTRKRKDVQLNEVTVKVILFGFDLLYLDGEVTSSPISLTSRR
jgi:DNA ligase 1